MVLIFQSVVWLWYHVKKRERELIRNHGTFWYFCWFAMVLPSCHCLKFYMYKSIGSLGFFFFLKISYAHQGCIYLINISVKQKICEQLLQFKIIIFYCNVLDFSASLLQGHMILQKSFCWFAAYFLLLLLSMLKTVVLFKTFVETVIHS